MGKLTKYEKIIEIDGYMVDIRTQHTRFDANVTHGRRDVGVVWILYDRKHHPQNLVKINGSNGFRVVDEVDQKIKDLQVLKKVYLMLVGYCNEVFYK